MLAKREQDGTQNDREAHTAGGGQEGVGEKGVDSTVSNQKDLLQPQKKRQRRFNDRAVRTVDALLVAVNDYPSQVQTKEITVVSSLDCLLAEQNILTEDLLRRLQHIRAKFKQACVYDTSVTDDLLF